MREGENNRAALQFPRKKFYFSGAIRGDTTYEKNFPKIIRTISEYGEPLTERSDLYNPLDKTLDLEKKKAKEKRVYRRDIIHWMGQSHAVIAEISGGSIGVGYEIRYAIKDLRIPVFCMYHKSSMPSLIVKQDPSKYVILQQYSNETDLEKYLRCFLRIISLTGDIEDIRPIYMRVSREIAESDLSAQEIYERIDDLTKIGDSTILQKDLTSMHVLRLRPQDIDFKDVASFANFMLRNIILQKRWEELRSQRIGATFVSGRKRKIIVALSDFYGPANLLDIYKLLGEDRLSYTREAFTKNIRAYRRIGLFKTSAEPKLEIVRMRGTKFKDILGLTQTLEGKIRIESSRSRREVMRRLIIPTSHLQHLSVFVEKYGSDSLEDLLKESKMQSWLQKIPEMAIPDIDDIDLSSIKEQRAAEEISHNLHEMCKRFWKKHYSSFALEKISEPELRH